MARAHIESESSRISPKRWNASPKVSLYMGLLLFAGAHLQLLESAPLGDLIADEPVEVSVAPLSDSDIKRICSDKKFQFDGHAQVAQLVVAVSQNPKLCKERFVGSLRELDVILKLEPNEYCSARAFELMKGYHFRYISPPRYVNRAPNQFEPNPREIVRDQLHPEPRTYAIQVDEFDQALGVPLAVRHFFLGLMLQISATCKRNLLANLSDASKRLLTEDDFKVMMLFNNETKVGELLSDDMARIDFDNIVYMPLLEGERKRGDSKIATKKVYLKPSIGPDTALFDLVNGCQNRFKPIYDQLVMPVVKLGKLGYDYQGDQLTWDERTRLAGPEVKSWLGIVHVCEMFNNIIVIEDPNIEVATHPIEIDELAYLSDDDTTKVAVSVPRTHSKSATLATIAEVSSGSGVDNIERINAEDEHIESLEQIEQVDEQEIERLKSANLVKSYEPTPIDYKMRRKVSIDRSCWIHSESTLDLELSKKSGNKNPFGFKGFIRKKSRAVFRLLGKLDMERFAHYRRNSAFYSGALNAISALSNIASIAVTWVYTVPGIVALG